VSQKTAIYNTTPVQEARNKIRRLHWKRALPFLLEDEIKNLHFEQSLGPTMIH
jgi:hypothetical protein